VGKGTDILGNFSTYNRSCGRERFFIHGLWEMSRSYYTFQTHTPCGKCGWEIGDWGIDVGWCGGWSCYEFCPVCLLLSPSPSSHLLSLWVICFVIAYSILPSHGFDIITVTISDP